MSYTFNGKPPAPDIADDLRRLTTLSDYLVQCRNILKREMGRRPETTVTADDADSRAEELLILEANMRLAMAQTQIMRQRITSDLEGLLGQTTAPATLCNIAQAIAQAHTVAGHATDMLEDQNRPEPDA